MKIDEHHRIAGARERLRVPAPVPQIRETSLRSAVNDEGHRIAAILLELRRLHHVAEHILVVPALEAELLRLTESTAREQSFIDARELPGLATIESDGVQIGGFAQG